MIQKWEKENDDEVFIPELKVHIHRKVSTDSKVSKEEIYREILSNFRYKRKSIPRVELAYQHPRQDSITKREIFESRPVTSPIAVMLKSNQPETGNKRLKKPRLKELPLLRRNQNTKNSEISVSGNSVSYCDWVGVLLYNRSIGKSAKSNEKFMNGQKTEIHQNIKKLRKRVIKGRSLFKNSA